MNQKTTWLVEPRFRQQLGVMLGMQDSMNAMVFPDWAERQLAWHRAIYVEAAEFLEHLGTWKWWKKGEPDFPQANMELVDIWHFGLSWYIERFGQPLDSEALSTAITRRIKEAVATLPASEDTFYVTPEMRHEAVDRLVHSAGGRLFNTEAFVQLIAYCGMNFDVLFQRYVGKNMLNRFRQENGYKQGTYIKVWAEQEDNVHLDSILDSLTELPAVDLPREVHRQLTLRYQQTVLAA